MKKLHWGVLLFALITSVLFSVAIKYLIPEEPMVVERFKETPKIPVNTYVYKFGKTKDSLTAINERVRRNETFLQILEKYNIPHSQAQEILSKTESIFDFHKLNAGSRYTIYQTSDSNKSTKVLVFDPNPRESIILKFGDTLTVVKEEKELEVAHKAIGGTINSSLYETLIEQNAPQQLAYDLSKIFATKVDFFKIHEGDKFKIIYDEVSLEGNPIGAEKIYSAYFEHGDEKYYAINFEENGRSQYYDEKGKNMKRGFLKAPLKFFRISSRYSKKRFHPVQKIFKAHLGTDYAAPTGTPILATANGAIIEAKYSRFNGNYVKIRHNNTYSTQYLHMSRIAKGMKPGKKVTQGQVIGYVGSTGLATGPHVCYRFWKNGKQVDPKTVSANFSEPLPKSKLKAFTKVKETQLQELNNISI